MKIVNDLVGRITATKGINDLAIRVADKIYNGTFRPDEPEASEDTVIGALIRCDKAETGYHDIEIKLNSMVGWRQRVSNLARH